MRTFLVGLAFILLVVSSATFVFWLLLNHIVMFSLLIILGCAYPVGTLVRDEVANYIVHKRAQGDE